MIFVDSISCPINSSGSSKMTENTLSIKILYFYMYKFGTLQKSKKLICTPSNIKESSIFISLNISYELLFSGC